MAARGEVERPHTPEEQEEDKKKKKKKKDKDVKEGPLEGQVWFLWSRDGALELGDAAAASGRCSFGAGMVPPKSVPVLGAVAADRSMLLNATEKVLQVAWQPMGPQAGSLVHPQGTADHSCLGAVVTTERLVVLDGDLQLMASNRPLEHHVQVLSCVWAGPALFFSTSAEEVWGTMLMAMMIIVIHALLCEHPCRYALVTLLCLLCPVSHAASSRCTNLGGGGPLCGALPCLMAPPARWLGPWLTACWSAPECRASQRSCLVFSIWGRCVVRVCDGRRLHTICYSLL